METNFSNKVALVTGGGAGMGRAASILFAKRGAKVAVNDSSIKRGQETVSIIRNSGGEAIFVQADVRIAAEVEAMIEAVVQNYCRLDIAFNNAGIRGVWAKLDQITEEDFDRVMDINLKGVFLSMKYEIRHMQQCGGGVIINMASAAGHKAADNLSIYSASKSGIIALTNAAAMEYGKDKIRIVAVSPSWVRTQLIEKMIKEKSLDGIPQDVSPLGRFCEPEEVAELVAWLASDSAAYISGGNILITGGASL